jgi:tripartite-type tricarboxylate transporter receptor subunit TctC
VGGVARVLAGLVAVACALPAAAGDVPTPYPEKPIRMLYGFPPGSDVGPRVFTEKLAESLGKPIIFENIPGAGGNVAAERAAKAVPDGYTLWIGSHGSIVVNVTLYAKLPYDPLKDFMPITRLFTFPNLLVVNNDVPARNVQDLVLLAKAQPGTLTHGHSGIGTSTHLAFELMKSMAGIDVQQVPYRGPSSVIPDLVSGRIAMCICGIGQMTPLVREGKVRALAVTSPGRWPFMPDLPTMAESGFSGFDARVWLGLFAPAGTPAAIVDTLHRHAVKVLARADVRNKFADLGFLPVGETPAEFADAIQAEIPLWAKVIRDSGTKISQ